MCPKSGPHSPPRREESRAKKLLAQRSDVLEAAILSGAFALALWGAWRPHHRAASYLVAGAVAAALIAVLVATGQTNMAIVCSVLVAALFGPLVIINQRRAQRRRSPAARPQAGST